MHEVFVDGVWQAGRGALIIARNPATGVVGWRGASATVQEIDIACRSARRRVELWADLGVVQRAAVCTRFSDLLTTHAEELALLISEEVGKPMWESRLEVAAVIECIALAVSDYTGRAESNEKIQADGRASVEYRPLGVVAVFGPFNLPAQLPHEQIIPALLAGNTIVFKPSTYAPRTSIRLMQLWDRAGLPGGVMNMVMGGAATGAALASHNDVDAVLLTGSHRTGKLLHQQFAGKPHKLLALKMGGNNPIVAWDVADIDTAVNLIVQSAFMTAGQRCTSAQRLIVPIGGVGDALVSRLTEICAAMHIGPFAALPEPFMGPVISTVQAERLLRAQDALIAAGAVAIMRMQHMAADTGLVTPALLDATQVAVLPDEEWLGPVLHIQRVPDFDNALRQANASRYGVSAALLSDDGARWEQFRAKARAGTLCWNCPTTDVAETLPHAGIGDSGNHRAGGLHAANHCSYPLVSMCGPSLATSRSWPPGLEAVTPPAAPLPVA